MPTQSGKSSPKVIQAVAEMGATQNAVRIEVPDDKRTIYIINIGLPYVSNKKLKRSGVLYSCSGRQDMATA